MFLYSLMGKGFMVWVKKKHETLLEELRITNPNSSNEDNVCVQVMHYFYVLIPQKITMHALQVQEKEKENKETLSITLSGSDVRNFWPL